MKKLKVMRILTKRNLGSSYFRGNLTTILKRLYWEFGIIVCEKKNYNS